MAVQTDIGVRVGADIGPLRRDLKKAGGLLEGFGKEARQHLNSIASGVAAGMAAATAAVVALGVRSAASAKELQTFARIADTSVSSFQRLAFGARSVGIEQDKLADILKDVKDRVGDFLTTGGGPMVDFFEQVAPKVGVTADQFRYLSGPDALQLFVSSLEAANLSQAEMTFHMEAMASDATKLLPLLRDNGKAMGEMGKQADALGIVLSEIEVAQLAQMGTDLDTLSSAFGTLSDKLSAQFAPLVTQLIADLTEAGAKAGNFETATTAAFNNIISAAGFVLDAIEGIKRVFRIVANNIIISGAAIASGFATSLTPVTLALEGIASAIDVVNKAVRNAIVGLEKTLRMGGGITESARRQLTALREEMDRSAEDGLANSIRGVISGIESIGTTASAVITEAMADTREQLETPLPSNNFRRWAADAQEAGRQATAALQGATQTAPALPAPDTGGGLGAFTAEDALKLPIVESEDRLASLRDSFKTEMEILQEQNEIRLADIQSFQEQGLLMEGEYQSLSEEQAKRHAAAMAAIKERENSWTVTSTEDMFNQLGALMGARSKKMFEIGKAASLANATVKGLQAIVNSYEAGTRIHPVVGAAYAATAAATTAMMIQNIRAQQYGGGGGAGTAGAAATAGSSVATAGAGAGTQQASPLEVRMTGLDSGTMFSGEMISTMFDRLREEAGDRGVRFVT
jgi:uncharacterized protein (UPF0254 family)